MQDNQASGELLRQKKSIGKYPKPVSGITGITGELQQRPKSHGTALQMGAYSPNPSHKGRLLW